MDFQSAMAGLRDGVPGDDAYGRVTRAVLAGALHIRWPGLDWSFGPLEVNDFSFCIAGRAHTGGSHRGVYIKIPKRRIAKTKLQEIDEEDRAMGRRELASLKTLAKEWPQDVGVSYVEPIDYLPAFNAIITRRVFGADFSVWLRRLDTRSRIFGRPPNAFAIEAMTRVGRALAGFHMKKANQTFTDEHKLTAKFKGYLQRLKDRGLDDQVLTRITALSTPQSISSAVRYLPTTSTLKGLDIRNLLLEEDSAKLVFLDPGRTKEDSPLADYARFWATLHLLYWGKLRFFLRWQPDAAYLRAFERGYFGGTSPRCARVYQAKELCRMWLMAYEALETKPLPRAVKDVLARTYINRFFNMWLATLECVDG